MISKTVKALISFFLILKEATYFSELDSTEKHILIILEGTQASSFLEQIPTPEVRVF